MTGTNKIPLKNLLLHISNVVNACDLSSVTSCRVKEYLKHRFKDALPCENDLDIILENVIKSVKLSQSLNGHSVHFGEGNYDSLDTDAFVENEIQDKDKKRITRKIGVYYVLKKSMDPNACKAYSYSVKNPFTSKTIRIIKPFPSKKKNETNGNACGMKNTETEKTSEHLIISKERTREGTRAILKQHFKEIPDHILTKVIKSSHSFEEAFMKCTEVQVQVPNSSSEEHTQQGVITLPIANKKKPSKVVQKKKKLPGKNMKAKQNLSKDDEWCMKPPKGEVKMCLVKKSPHMGAKQNLSKGDEWCIKQTTGEVKMRLVKKSPHMIGNC